MLTLRNPRFRDRHPHRAWFNDHRQLLGGHLLWAIAMICLQALAAVPGGMMG